jgi:hypothetical protein
MDWREQTCAGGLVRANMKPLAACLTTRGTGGDASHSQRSSSWRHVSETAMAAVESRLGAMMTDGRDVSKMTEEEAPVEARMSDVKDRQDKINPE